MVVVPASEDVDWQSIAWLSFWEQFKKVDKDVSIDNDKIKYLKLATFPGSRTRQLSESYPATGKHYSKIVETFGRKYLQIEIHARKLLKLVLTTATAKEKPEISRLYDSMETQLQALETLAITTDSYAVPSCGVVHTTRITSRLTSIFVLQWFREKIAIYNGNNIEVDAFSSTRSREPV